MGLAGVADSAGGGGGLKGAGAAGLSAGPFGAPGAAKAAGAVSTSPQRAQATFLPAAVSGAMSLAPHFPQTMAMGMAQRPGCGAIIPSGC